MTRTILLVDDSDAVRLTFAALLESDGHHVVEASTLAEARGQLAAATLDAAVVDLHLPDGLGTALFDEVRARHPRAAIVLLSGADAVEAPVGADLVLEKGQDPERLGALIEDAIAKRA
jgi:DNA-binding NtrC family response regulator